MPWATEGYKTRISGMLFRYKDEKQRAPSVLGEFRLSRGRLTTIDLSSCNALYLGYNKDPRCPLGYRLVHAVQPPYEMTKTLKWSRVPLKGTISALYNYWVFYIILQNERTISGWFPDYELRSLSSVGREAALRNSVDQPVSERRVTRDWYAV